MLLFFFILSLLLNGTLGYVAWNMLRKQETLEDFIVTAYTQAQRALHQMRSLDELGAFEADDEVGAAFREMKLTIEDYAQFLGVEEETNPNAEKTRQKA